MLRVYMFIYNGNSISRNLIIGILDEGNCQNAPQNALLLPVCSLNKNGKVDSIPLKVKGCQVMQ